MIAHAKTRLAKLEAKASPPMQVRDIDVSDESEMKEAFADAFLAATGPTLLRFSVCGQFHHESVVGDCSHEEMLEQLREYQCR